MAPKIGSTIEKLFRTDKTVGYYIRDLREVFWVEHPGAGSS